MLIPSKQNFTYFKRVSAIDMVFAVNPKASKNDLVREFLLLLVKSSSKKCGAVNKGVRAVTDFS